MQRLAWSTLAVVAIVLAGASTASASDAPAERTTISGRSLPHSITRSRRDDLALYEPEVSDGGPVEPPELLAARPPRCDPRLLVESGYRAWLGDRSGVSGLDGVAAYDASSGVARVRAGADQWWGWCSTPPAQRCCSATSRSAKVRGCPPSRR